MMFDANVEVCFMQILRTWVSQELRSSYKMLEAKRAFYKFALIAMTVENIP